MKTDVPIIGFAAPSGMGKTTLMEKVITVLTREGMRVAAIKHGHHPVDPDSPGKDTWRFRQAGAKTVLFASAKRWFMIQEPTEEEDDQPPLKTLIARVTGKDDPHDLVLIEGFKHADYAKIFVYRRHNDNDALRRKSTLALFRQMRSVIAVATDDPAFFVDAGVPDHLPMIPLDDPEQVALLIKDVIEREIWNNSP